MGTKNSKFSDEFRSVGKTAKNAYEKSYEQNSQLKVHFLGFYLYMKFCIYNTHIDFFKNIFWGSICTYFLETLEQNAHPMEQNIKKFFL